MSREIFAVLAALAGGAFAASLVGALAALAGGPGQALRAFYGREENPRPERGSLRERIIARSLGIPAEALPLIRFGIPPLAFLLAMAAGIPLPPAVGAGALALVLAHSFLEGRYRRFLVELERDLPAFVARLGGALAVEASPMAVVEEVTLTLPPGSPLRSWWERALEAWRARGIVGLEEIQREASDLSPSLGMVAFMIRRLGEAGGGRWVEAFRTVADELSVLLEARAVKSAKAEAVRGAVRMLLGILAIVALLYFRAPAIRAGFADPTVALVAIGAFGAMAFGYVFLNSMIDDALED